MTARHTESLKLNKDAILPVVLSLVAFFLSLAAWWLAWLVGLIVLILWLIMMILFEYIPRVDWILLTTLICACLAAVSELYVVANINNAATCGNDDDDEGEECKYLAPALKMIVAAVAMILWGTVAYLTFQKYRATAGFVVSTTTPTTKTTKKTNNTENTPNNSEEERV